MKEEKDKVERDSYLLTLCMKYFHKKTIVFFNKKSQCHRAFILFSLFGLRVAEIYGDMS